MSSLIHVLLYNYNAVCTTRLKIFRKKPKIHCSNIESIKKLKFIQVYKLPRNICSENLSVVLIFISETCRKNLDTFAKSTKLTERISKILIFLKLFWTRKSRFGNPAQKWLTKVQKSSSKKPYKFNERKFPPKKNLKFLSWTRNFSFDNLAETLTSKIDVENAISFWSKSEIIYGNIFFSERNSSLTYTPLGHTGRSFDNTAKTFLLKFWKLFFQSPKKFMKPIVPENFFSSKCFSGHRELSFYNPPENNLSKVRKIMLKVQNFENFRNSCFSMKTTSGHVTSDLTTVPKIICQKSENPSLRNRETFQKTSYSNKQSSKSNAGHVDCTFGNPAKSFTQKLENCSLRIREEWKKMTTFPENFLSSNTSSEHVKAILTTLAKNLRGKSNRFLLKIWNWIRN